MTTREKVLAGVWETLCALWGLFAAVWCFVDLLPMGVGFLRIYLPAAWVTLLILCLLWLMKKPWRGLLVLALLLMAYCLYDPEKMIQGGAQVGCSLSEVYSQHIDGVKQFYPLQDLLVSEARRVAEHFLTVCFGLVGGLLAFSFHYRWFVPAFLPLGGVILAQALVLRTPPLWALFSMLFLLLWLAFCAHHARSRAAFRQGALLLPGVALLLCLAWVLCPREGYQRSPQVENLRLQLNQLANGNRVSLNVLIPFQGQKGRSQLNDTGRLQFTGETALRVYCTQPQKLYLKGFSADRYEGDRWAQSSALEYDALLGQLEFSPFTLTAQAMRATWPETASYEVQVELVAPNGNYYYLPYGMVSLQNEGESLTRVKDSYMNSMGPGTQYAVSAVALPDWSQNQSLSLPQSLAVAESQYQQYAQDTCLQVPEELEDWLTELAYSIVSPEDTLETKVDKISAWVRQAARYDAAPGTVPPGKDYVEYFLTENKKGYCMHFASAGVLLLRAAGVPARYVEGYVVSEGDITPETWLAVPDSQAHAWAEVYVPFLGFLPVEMTPGYGGAIPQQAEVVPEEPEEVPEEIPEETPEEVEPAPEEIPEETEPETEEPEEELPEEQAKQSSPWPLVMLLGLVLVSAGGGWLWFRPRWQRRQETCGSSRSRAAAIYRRIQALEKYAPAPPRAPELADKACFSKNGLSEQELIELAGLARQMEQDAKAGAKPLGRLWLRWGKGISG